jgi:hypothetical protein
MKRREFLTTSLTASSLLSLSCATTRHHSPVSLNRNREYYEWRIYRFKPGANRELLDSYLEKAAIPALNRLGSKPIGAFTEIEPKDAPAVFVLIPHPSFESFTAATTRLETDRDYQQAGAPYLQTAKSTPGFERIDSWLLLAFAGMPRLELPAASREKKPRIFEVRTYESYSEVKALKKVHMFDSGEIDLMREVAMGPVFFGQALIGRDLPHLTYMLSAENDQAHKQHWAAFSKHPAWDKMKNDPQYADTVSKITNHFLIPTAYSQI